ncbi:MAG: hypothetical protein R2838_15310 [Caldilineaceae bacterium]
MKVGKEEMVGLLKAVELYLQIDQEAGIPGRGDGHGLVFGAQRRAGVRARRAFPTKPASRCPVPASMSTRHRSASPAIRSSGNSGR